MLVLQATPPARPKERTQRECRRKETLCRVHSVEVHWLQPIQDRPACVLHLLEKPPALKDRSRQLCVILASICGGGVHEFSEHGGTQNSFRAHRDVRGLYIHESVSV